MPDQEFLASFAVEIDESGVQRLQQVLEQNRDLADALAETFRHAKAELDAFFGELSGLSLPTGFSAFSRVSEEAAGLSFPVSLDFSKANKELAAFAKSATKALTLRADASGVVSAGTAALNQLRSLFASTKLPLQVEIQEGGSSPSSGSGSSDPSSAGKTPTQKTVPEPSGQEDPFHPVALPAATGGRFDKPTYTEIAEDGDPEYVIPVKKEPLAVPLLSQLVSELSDSAKETLRAAMGEKKEEQPEPAPVRKTAEPISSAPAQAANLRQAETSSPAPTQPAPARQVETPPTALFQPAPVRQAEIPLFRRNRTIPS